MRREFLPTATVLSAMAVAIGGNALGSTELSTASAAPSPSPATATPKVHNTYEANLREYSYQLRDGRKLRVGQWCGTVARPPEAYGALLSEIISPSSVMKIKPIVDKNSLACLDGVVTRKDAVPTYTLGDFRKRAKTDKTPARWIDPMPGR